MEPRYRLPEQDELAPYEPLSDYQYSPIRPQRTFRDLLRKIWAPIAAAGAFLAKFGAVLFKAKFFFSIFISFGFYLWYGGVWFAVGLIVLLFVHEMGHVIEARRQGLPVSAPMFIPFLGAAITLKENPRDAWHEATMALAGPILGSLGAAAIYALGVVEDSNRLKAIAFLGFFINLFNLLPIVPLDGGRAVAALHPALWLVGLVGLAGLVVLRPNPILILILVFAAMELYRRWQMRSYPGARAYYRVLPWQRAAVALTYFGLAALLVLGMHETHVPHSF
jgi:Zn-dependent protease